VAHVSDTTLGNELVGTCVSRAHRKGFFLNSAPAVAASADGASKSLCERGKQRCGTAGRRPTETMAGPTGSLTNSIRLSVRLRLDPAYCSETQTDAGALHGEKMERLAQVEIDPGVAVSRWRDRIDSPPEVNLQRLRPGRLTKPQAEAGAFRGWERCSLCMRCQTAPNGGLSPLFRTALHNRLLMGSTAVSSKRGRTDDFCGGTTEPCAPLADRSQRRGGPWFSHGTHRVFIIARH